MTLTNSIPHDRGTQFPQGYSEQSVSAPHKEVSGPLLDVLASLEAVRAAGNAWNTEVYDPALAAYAASKEAIGHSTTRQTFINAFGEERHMDTSKVMVVETARSILAWPDIDTGDHDPAWVEVMREVVCLNDERQAKLKQLHIDHRVNELRLESDAWSDRENAAYEAVLETPAASLSDLIAKLKFIEAEQEFCEWSHKLITADVFRLAGAA